jgi:hypothetical protein
VTSIETSGGRSTWLWGLPFSLHGPLTENKAPYCCVRMLVFPRDRYSASPLACWLLPINRKHSSHCCVCVLRAWPRDGHPSVVACTSVAQCLTTRCLAILSANPSQYCSMYSSCYETMTRWTDTPGPFLGNGSINAFPQQHTRKQQ